MSHYEIASPTKEYIRVAVSATEAGADVDVSALPVSFAFTAIGAEPASWTGGAWETDATTDPDTYYARILVSGTGGGGGVELADGRYDVWVKVTDNPEVPARRVGRLIVT